MHDIQLDVMLFIGYENTTYFFLFFSIYFLRAQTLEIAFPKFAGKTYEFIIFQGSEMVKVKENDTIPHDGVVKLVIPPKYAPYTGMCRWLNTATVI